jgi:hypothetical protein
MRITAPAATFYHVKKEADLLLDHYLLFRTRDSGEDPETNKPEGNIPLSQAFRIYLWITRLTLNDVCFLSTD